MVGAYLRNACMSKSQAFVCYSGSYFVARHNADLNLRVTESECVIRLAAFMRNTGIPWAFTYGNHDTESLASANKQELNEVYKSLSFKTSGNLLYPYTQPDVMGRNNQLIEIRNSDGTLNTWLFIPHLSLAAHRDSSAATTTTTMRQSNTRVFA